MAALGRHKAVAQGSRQLSLCRVPINLRISSCSASLALAVSLFGVSAKAAPFRFTAVSFQAYLNSLKWRGGKTVAFSHIGSCMVREPVTAEQLPNGTMWVNPFAHMTRPSDTEYSCREGYVTESSPLGTRICELSPFGATARSGGGVSWVKGQGVSYNVIGSSCRWR